MLGFEILDAGLMSAILIALSAGMLSFVSPCVLPVVPPYLAYMSGVSFDELKHQQGHRSGVMLCALAFFFGLSTVFLLLGAAATSIGVIFLKNQILFGRIAGVAIVIFGLHFLGVFRIPILNREFRFRVERSRAGVPAAYLLGLAFAFGWAPCIGPQLGAILTLAAQEDSIYKGTLLLGVYAIGLGVPFLLAAAFIDRFINVFDSLKTYMRLIERSIGVLLLAIGLLLLTNRFSVIAFWLLETFPALALIG